MRTFIQVTYDLLVSQTSFIHSKIVSSLLSALSLHAAHQKYDTTGPVLMVVRRFASVTSLTPDWYGGSPVRPRCRAS